VVQRVFEQMMQAYRTQCDIPEAYIRKNSCDRPLRYIYVWL